MRRRAVSLAELPYLAYPLGALVFVSVLLLSFNSALRFSEPPWFGVWVASGLLGAILLLLGISFHYHLALALYFFSLPTQNMALLPYFTPVKLAFLLLLYAFTVACFKRERACKWVPRLHVPQIVFVTIAALTTVLHYQSDEFAAREILRFVSVMVLLAFLPSLFSSKRDFQVACWAGAAVLAAMEVYAGIQSLKGMGRIPATFAHGADFAVFLIFTIPLCWYLMTLPETGRGFRWFLAGVSFVGFFCILLTGTRSGYLGAAVMIIGAFVFFPRLRIPVTVMAAVSVLVFLALWPYLTDLRGEIGRKFRFESGKGQMGVEVSTSIRILTLDVAQRIIRKNPLLGIGVGSFRREMLAYIPKEYQGFFVHTVATRKGGRVAHNTFADVWAETGTLGFLAFLILVGMGVWNLLHWGFRGPGDSSHLAKFLLMAHVGTFMTGFLHGGFLVSQYCWLYLGMGFGLPGIMRTGFNEEPAGAGQE